MKRIFLILLVLLTASIINAQDEEATETVSIAPPAPPQTIEGDGVILDLYFSTLRQGRVGLIGLRGNRITHAQADIFNTRVDFFTIDDKPGYYALIAASIEQSIHAYDLVVSIETSNRRQPQIISTSIEVISGNFIQQNVILPPDDKLIELLDPQIEADELAFIYETTAPITEDVLWNAQGFIPPLNSELTSPFGAVRTFNEGFYSIHTGWDYQARIGEPMIASSSGEVVFADYTPLRGNYVLINHGRGVYSGYAHLSVSYVTQGQQINIGQIIGLVGSTGRSSSAHAHIEFIVNGQWVDAADFIRMYIP